MRDPKLTGYAPQPVEGVTPDQRIEVESTVHPCDGEIGVGALGHPRVWLRMSPGRIWSVLSVIDRGKVSLVKQTRGPMKTQFSMVTPW